MPVCKVKVRFDFSPVNPYHSYGEGDSDCTYLAEINIPFFLERPGPKYEEITVMAHESYPGHHLEVSGIKYFHSHIQALKYQLIYFNFDLMLSKSFIQRSGFKHCNNIPVHYSWNLAGSLC